MPVEEVRNRLMNDSILIDIKKLLGLAENYNEFDKDIMIHINSVFTILRQLGIGPAEGFKITGVADTWSSFSENMSMIEDVKSYIYLKVRMLFDPPNNSVLASSIEKEISEFEWRLNIESS